jgi:hypothetical protein
MQQRIRYGLEGDSGKIRIRWRICWKRTKPTSTPKTLQNVRCQDAYKHRTRPGTALTGCYSPIESTDHYIIIHGWLAEAQAGTDRESVGSHSRSNLSRNRPRCLGAVERSTDTRTKHFWLFHRAQLHLTKATWVAGRRPEAAVLWSGTFEAVSLRASVEAARTTC